MPQASNWLFEESPTNSNTLSALFKRRSNKLGKDKFFKPDFPSVNYYLERNILDSESLLKAKELIDTAIATDRKIIIYGDYDADGITSTAIVWEYFFDVLGYKKVHPIIPNRMDDGYGLSSKLINEIAENYPNALIITVDCGVTGFNEVKLTQDHGMTIIVTDHHELPEQPSQPDVLIHSTKLTGSIISFIFMNYLANNLDDKVIGLDLACLGAIADMAEGDDINRGLFWHGVKALNCTSRVGIRVIKDILNMGKDLKASDYSWQIIPRLNSAGRISSPLISLRLLCTKNLEKAKSLFFELEEINSLRQDLTKKALIEISESQFEEEIIIASSEDWHEGIIGLISAKLKDIHQKPAIVFSISGESAKGSGRSVKGYSLIDKLRAHEDIFKKLGGHQMAVGLSIETRNIQVLQSRLKGEKITEQEHEKVIKIDAVIPSAEFTSTTFDKISSLEPFTKYNEEPIIALENLKLIKATTVGQEKNHLKLSFQKSQKVIECMFFGLNKIPKLVLEKEYDVCGLFQLNSFNNKVSPFLKAISLRTSETGEIII